MQDDILPSGRYRSTYRPGAIVGQHTITLVQSDLLVRDGEFDNYLDAIGPLDAITLWFSGIHKARSSTEVAHVFEVKSDADHRELVEDASIELAERRLRPGGWLQIVIRGGFPLRNWPDLLSRTRLSRRLKIVDSPVSRSLPSLTRSLWQAQLSEYDRVTQR